MNPGTTFVPAMDSSPKVSDRVLNSITSEPEISEEATSTTESMHVMKPNSKAIITSTGVVMVYILVNLIFSLIIKFPLLLVKIALYLPCSAGKTLVVSIKLRASSFYPSLYVQKKCNAAILKIKAKYETTLNYHKLLTLQREEIYDSLKLLFVTWGIYFARKKSMHIRLFRIRELLRIKLIRLRFDMLFDSLEILKSSSITIIAKKINVLLDTITNRLKSIEIPVWGIKDINKKNSETVQSTLGNSCSQL